MEGRRSSEGTSAPLMRFGGGGEVCTASRGTVYRAERMLCNGQVYHAECFRCSDCQTRLTATSWHRENGRSTGALLCAAHFTQRLNASGMRASMPSWAREEEQQKARSEPPSGLFDWLPFCCAPRTGKRPSSHDPWASEPSPMRPEVERLEAQLLEQRAQTSFHEADASEAKQLTEALKLKLRGETKRLLSAELEARSLQEQLEALKAKQEKTDWDRKVRERKEELEEKARERREGSVHKAMQEQARERSSEADLQSTTKDLMMELAAEPVKEPVKEPVRQPMREPKKEPIKEPVKEQKAEVKRPSREQMEWDQKVLERKEELEAKARERRAESVARILAMSNLAQSEPEKATSSAKGRSGSGRNTPTIEVSVLPTARKAFSFGRSSHEDEAEVAEGRPLARKSSSFGRKPSLLFGKKLSWGKKS
jgi:hypothetical protein